DHRHTAMAATVHAREARIEVGPELDQYGRTGRGPGHDVAQHIVDVDVREPHAHPSRLHAVEVQHVPDKTVDPVRVIEYVYAVGAHLVRLDAAIGDPLASFLDRGRLRTEPCVSGA